MTNKNQNVKIVALLPAQKQSNMELLERLVRERVDEILATRQDLLMRPFFDSKRVSDEIRKLQTMVERRKWPKYFERHGCLICKAKKVRRHDQLGMCAKCFGRTTQRLKAIIAEDERNQECAKFATTLESTARRALRYALDTRRDHPPKP